MDKKVLWKQIVHVEEQKKGGMVARGGRWK